MTIKMLEDLGNGKYLFNFHGQRIVTTKSAIEDAIKTLQDAKANGKPLPGIPIEVLQIN